MRQNKIGQFSSAESQVNIAANRFRIKIVVVFLENKLLNVRFIKFNGINRIFGFWKFKISKPFDFVGFLLLLKHRRRFPFQNNKNTRFTRKNCHGLRPKSVTNDFFWNSCVQIKFSLISSLFSIFLLINQSMVEEIDFFFLFEMF